jgi:organic hydroperoxide reductase OsmC/OhrA
VIKAHHYAATVNWTGARHGTTTSYKAYSREYTASVAGKPALSLSADPAFLGDGSLHNPEDLLVLSLSACHLLTYLAECARVGVHVLAYDDQASGTMTWNGTTYQFSEVVLRPHVVIAAGGDVDQATELHHRSHELCFIAQSMNFPVRHEPHVTVSTGEM